jgi:heme exporter protein C
MVRTTATDPSRGSVFAAVVGIVAFVDVPIIGMSTTLWRGIHPGGIILEGGLAPPMLLTLLVSLAAFTALYALILIIRVAVKNDQMTIDKLKTLRG